MSSFAPKTYQSQVLESIEAYAFVVSRNFAETASALRDRLVAGAGFERREVTEFVTAARADQARFDLDNSHVVFQPVPIVLTEKPNLKALPKTIKDKLHWEPKHNILTISAPLTEDETEALKASVTSDAAVTAIADAAEISRTTAIEFFQTPAELGERFHIPQLALRVPSPPAPLPGGEGSQFVLFDDPEVLEYPWDLSPYDAAPTADDLPEQSLTHGAKQAFVAAWLAELLRRDGYTLARANLQKFLIRNLIEARIRDLRKQAVGSAFQQVLFGDDAASRVAVSDLHPFDFHPQAYAPSRDYDGRFGHFDFRKHFYGRMGDFDSKEEFECACWLDMQAQKGRIQFWVRNLVRREGSSFFLQKADDRFYPDFLCCVPGAGDQPGAILAVEYKGADRWTDAKDDRLIGELWAELSGGRCRFVMVKEKRWDGIDSLLQLASTTPPSTCCARATRPGGCCARITRRWWRVSCSGCSSRPMCG